MKLIQFGVTEAKKYLTIEKHRKNPANFLRFKTNKY